MYLIFNTDIKYIGYTDNEELLNKFLSQRKEKKFVIQRVKKDNIEKSLKKDLFDKDKKLKLIDDEKGIVGFKYEDKDLTSFFMEVCIDCSFSLEELAKKMVYLIFDEDEEKNIISMTRSLNDKIKEVLLMDDLDIFDVDGVMEKCNWEIYPTYPTED